MVKPYHAKLGNVVHGEIYASAYVKSFHDLRGRYFRCSTDKRLCADIKHDHFRTVIRCVIDYKRLRVRELGGDVGCLSERRFSHSPPIESQVSVKVYRASAGKCRTYNKSVEFNEISKGIRCRIFVRVRNHYGSALCDSFGNLCRCDLCRSTDKRFFCKVHIDRRRTVISRSVDSESVRVFNSCRDFGNIA